MQTYESVPRDKLIHWKYYTCVHQERPEPLAGLGNESMRFPRSAQRYYRDIFATRAGSARRGIKRCAKMLSLVTKPGITSPPPLANDSKASLTTSSGD